MTLNYKHCDIDHSPIPYSPGKAVCVGRNYHDHIQELNNPVPKAPLLFIKPNTAMVGLEQPIQWPQDQGACHYELELAVLITEQLTQIEPGEVKSKLNQFYYGLAIDLTLRDLQQDLKQKGEPWEKAKAFDRACVLTPFVNGQIFLDHCDLNHVEFKLEINQQMRQQGQVADMITPVEELISYASTFFTLLPGDVILTGTPAGVGALNFGDYLDLYLNQQHFSVACGVEDRD